jgi:predicted metal-binding membrane protein
VIRGQVSAIALLLALAAAAWVITDLRMAGMDAGPGTDPGAFGFYISTWVVMMAAMMLPATMPMVLTYRNLERQRDPAATWLFIGGYLAVWAASGLVAYAALELGRSLTGSLFAWHRAGRVTAVVLLAAAAVYELTPLKHACLAKCRSPVGFLISSWRDGRKGALAMGAAHGGWCLGCCWMLMVALFALGAMSIVWMIVISALIALEKLLPWRAAAEISVAAVLVALAIGIAAAPSSVPALTIPGGGAMTTSGVSMR